jgi:hypothetical protein
VDRVFLTVPEEGQPSGDQPHTCRIPDVPAAVTDSSRDRSSGRGQRRDRTRLGSRGNVCHSMGEDRCAREVDRTGVFSWERRRNHKPRGVRVRATAFVLRPMAGADQLPAAAGRSPAHLRHGLGRKRAVASTVCARPGGAQSSVQSRHARELRSAAWTDGLRVPFLRHLRGRGLPDRVPAAPQLRPPFVRVRSRGASGRDGVFE